MSAVFLALRSADGTALHARRWEPAGKPRERCLLVHGLAEHLGRYEHVAAALNEAGYAVTGVELRGHGDSAGKRGHVRRWQDYSDDLAAAAATLEGRYALVAHSMGGLVALDALRAGVIRPWAMVLSSPLLGVAVEAPGWKLAAGKLLSRVLPGLSMSNELDPQLICSDPEVVAAYVADPKVFTTITPRWFTEMSAAAERVLAHAPRYALPVYVNLGLEDRIVSNESARAFHAALTVPKTLREWPGLRHETLNEPARGEVLGAMIGWLDAQRRAAQSAASTSSTSLA